MQFSRALCCFCCGTVVSTPKSTRYDCWRIDKDNAIGFNSGNASPLPVGWCQQHRSASNISEIIILLNAAYSACREIFLTRARSLLAEGGCAARLICVQAPSKDFRPTHPGSQSSRIDKWLLTPPRPWTLTDIVTDFPWAKHSDWDDTA